MTRHTASQASRAAITVNERRLGGRDPISTSISALSQRDMDASAYRVRKRTISSPAFNLRIPHLVIPPAVQHHTFQRIRTEEKKRSSAVAIVQAARSLAPGRGFARVTLTGSPNARGSTIPPVRRYFTCHNEVLLHRCGRRLESVVGTVCARLRDPGLRSPARVAEASANVRPPRT